MPSLLQIPWISQGWTPAGGARDRLFKGKLPAIRVISPIAPPSRNNWVISPLVPPRSSAYCSSPGTIWVISPIVLPMFGTARTPLKGAADPPVG